MQKCISCGKPVGCGCQLVNGLCSACRSIKKGVTNVAFTINKLFRE